MLKFSVSDDGPKPVELRLVRGEGGDVRLEANGFVILWVMRDGTLLRDYRMSAFSRMGFQTNSRGQVRMCGEED